MVHEKLDGGYDGRTPSRGERKEADSNGEGDWGGRSCDETDFAKRLEGKPGTGGREKPKGR